MQDRGADPDIQHSVRYGNFVWEKSCIFPCGKINYFSVWKIAYFSVWKNRGFLLAVLYWTVDGTARDSSGQLGTLGSGQKDCPVWDNGALDGPFCTGQKRLGTGGQWTGQSGQNLLSSSLLLRPSLIVFKWTDGVKNSSVKSIGYNGSVQPCRVLPIKSAGYANGWTELRKTHIYIYIIYLYIFPLLLTPLYYIYIFFTVQNKYIYSNYK